MYQQSFSSIKLWQFEQLAKTPAIKHFVSGRSGGVSEGELGGLNLSFKAGDKPEHVQQNRRLIAEALDISPENLFFPAQTHSTNAKVVNRQTLSDDLSDTDALVTNTPGLCICVMSADCVPVLLYDPVQRVVAAVHAGWRGTVGKILTNTVELMRQQFNTNPADLIAGIGPSICPQVYEVGPEVIAQVAQAFGKEGLVTNESAEGKGFLNLWEANRIQLLSLGVAAASIEISGLCTYQQSNEFFSARKSENKAGRFAAGIMLC